MKALLKQVAQADASVEGALKIIDRFDQLMVGGASLDRILLAAAEVSGRDVGIENTWSDVRVRVQEGRIRKIDVWDEHGIAVIDTAISRRLRGHRAQMLKTTLGEVIAASVEAANGRAGTVWLEAGARGWANVDFLIAERLAAAASMLMLRPAGADKLQSGPAALEHLLAAARTREEARSLADRAQLDLGGQYVAAALEANPPSAVGPEVLAGVGSRALRDSGQRAAPAVVGRTAFLVLPAQCDYAAALLGLAQADERVFRIRVGIGEPAAIDELHRSAAEAREALALGPLVNGEGRPTRFSELGVLHVLAQIPAEQIEAFADVARVGALDAGEPGVSDLRILEVYCETNSLRQTAIRLHLHHSTVNYRRRRIEQTLGFSLVEPGQRLRALLAFKLFQIAQLRRG